MSTASSQTRLRIKHLLKFLRAYSPDGKETDEEWSSRESMGATVGDVITIFKPTAKLANPTDAFELEVEGICLVFGEDADLPMNYFITDTAYEMSFLEGTLSAKAAEAKEKGLSLYCLRSTLLASVGMQTKSKLGQMRKLGGSGERKSPAGGLSDPLCQFFSALTIKFDPLMETDPLSVINLAVALWGDDKQKSEAKGPELDASFMPVEEENGGVDIDLSAVPVEPAMPAETSSEGSNGANGSAAAAGAAKMAAAEKDAGEVWDMLSSSKPKLSEIKEESDLKSLFKKHSGEAKKASSADALFGSSTSEIFASDDFFAAKSVDEMFGSSALTSNAEAEAKAAAQAEEESKAVAAKAEEEARLKAEEEAKAAATKAAEEAKLKAEEEEKAAQEALFKAEAEAKFAAAKAAEEAKQKAEEEAKAAEAALFKAEADAKEAAEKAEIEAKTKAEEAAKAALEAEEEARAKAEEEAKAKAEEEAKARAEEEAKAKAEEDAKAAAAKAEEEAIAASAKAEEEAKVAAAKAEEEAKAKAEEEAKAAAIKAEEEARAAAAKAEEEARSAAVKLDVEAKAATAKADEEFKSALAKAEEESGSASVKAEEEAIAVSAKLEEIPAAASSGETRPSLDESSVESSIDDSGDRTDLKDKLRAQAKGNEDVLNRKDLPTRQKIEMLLAKQKAAAAAKAKAKAEAEEAGEAAKAESKPAENAESEADDRKVSTAEGRTDNDTDDAGDEADSSSADSTSKPQKKLSLQATLTKLEEQSQKAHQKIAEFKKAHEDLCREDLHSVEKQSASFESDFKDRLNAQRKEIVVKMRKLSVQATEKLSDIIHEGKIRLEERGPHSLRELENVGKSIDLSTVDSDLEKAASKIAAYTNERLSVLGLFADGKDPLDAIVEEEIARIREWRATDLQDYIQLFEKVSGRFESRVQVVLSEIDSVAKSMLDELERLRDFDSRRYDAVARELSDSIANARRFGEMRVRAAADNALSRKVFPALGQMKGSLAKRADELRVQVSEKLEQYAQKSSKDFQNIIETAKGSFNSIGEELTSLRKNSLDRESKAVEERLEKLKTHLAHLHAELKKSAEAAASGDADQENSFESQAKEIGENCSRDLDQAFEQMKLDIAEDRKNSAAALKEDADRKQTELSNKLKAILEKRRASRKEALKKLDERLDQLAESVEAISSQLIQ